MSVVQSRPRGPARIAFALHNLLIEPAARLKDPARRRQARLLAGFALFEFVVFLGIVIAYRRITPDAPWTFTEPIGLAGLVLIYVLSRMGVTSIPVAILLSAWPLLVFLNVIQATTPDSSAMLSYLIPCMVIASVFLSPLHTAFYGIGLSLLMLTLPLIAPAHVPGISHVVGVIGAGLASTTLLIIAMAVRARVERDRQAELKHAYDSTLEGWAHALEIRDRDTEGHSRRVAELSVLLARACGLDDPDLEYVYRGALLHDIGKVLTHTHEGTHVELGVEVATKYGEHPVVLNAIAAHHDDVPHETPISVIVQAADAISGSRPGARREAFETYVKRLTNLETIATSYQGVEKCYAIQAGRELRVVVMPEVLDDAKAQQLSEQIARRIEQELQYPGQIKIVVVRETRAVDFAR